MSVFHAFSAAIIIFVSFLSMLIIYKNNKLHNIPGIFRFNLALSDCLCSLVFIGSAVTPYYYVFSPINFKNPDNSKYHLAQMFFLNQSSNNSFETFFLDNFKVDPVDQNKVNLFGFVCYSAGFASMYSFLAASIDRFFAIKYPFKYKRKATKSKAYKVCVLVWFCAILFTLIPWFSKDMKFFFYKDLFVFYKGKGEIFLDMLYHFLPLFFCWVINIITLISIRKNKQRMLNVLSTVQLPKCKNRRMANFETRASSAAKTIFIMVFVFTMSFLPFNIHQFIYHINSQRYASYRFAKINNNFSNNFYNATIFDKAYVFSVFLLYNNFWNFFIYQLRDADFRNYSKSLLCCLKKS